MDGSAGVDHTRVLRFPRAPQPAWVGGGQISTSETKNTGVIDPVHDGTAQFQAPAQGGRSAVLGHKTRGEGRKPKPKRYSIIAQLKYQAVLSDLYCSVRTLGRGKFANCGRPRLIAAPHHRKPKPKRHSIIAQLVTQLKHVLLDPYCSSRTLGTGNLGFVDVPHTHDQLRSP